MSVNTKFLYAFDHPLPPPFDKRSSRRVKVSSMYGDGTESTLSASFIKAVHAYLGCVDGSAAGAIGRLADQRIVVEMCIRDRACTAAVLRGLRTTHRCFPASWGQSPAGK